MSNTHKLQAVFWLSLAAFLAWSRPWTVRPDGAAS